MKEPFKTWNEAIEPQDKAAMARAKARWDGIAKPLDGLGKFETAIIRIAGLSGSEAVSIGKRTVVVLCADNGIVRVLTRFLALVRNSISGRPGVSSM